MHKYSYYSCQSDKQQEQLEEDSFQSVLASEDQQYYPMDNRPSAFVKHVPMHIKINQQNMHPNQIIIRSCFYEKQNHDYETNLTRSQYLEKPIIHDNDNDKLTRSEMRTPLLHQSFEIPFLDLQNTVSHAVALQKQPQPRIKPNRIGAIQIRNRPQRIQEKLVWSWDTSASLIRQMVRNKSKRYIINTYIWILIVLRIYYIILIAHYNIFYSDDLQDDFYYFIYGALIGIRILFCLITAKLLSIGQKTKDIKIKIVYETYQTLFSELNNNIKVKEQEMDRIVIRTPDDEIRQNKLRNVVRGLNRWVIALKTYIILIPPEISFICQKKQSNGFFQVQNYIMKSLDVFFFVPLFIFFLNDKLDIQSIFQSVPELKIYYITSWILLFDLIVFILLVILLLISNQRSKVYQNLF